MAKRVTKSQVMDILNKGEKAKRGELKRTKFVHGPGLKDQLASGQPSASYGMSGLFQSQEHFDLTFLTDKEFKKKYGHKKNG